MSRGAVTLVAAVAAFGLAAGASFVVVHDGEDEVASELPAAARPVPVLAPVPDSGTPGTDNAASGAGASAGSTGGGGAGDSAGDGGAPDSNTGGGGSGADGAGSGGGSSTDTAGSRVVSGLGDALTPAAAAGVPPRTPRFIDPCDVVDAGGASTDCAGRLGTILGGRAIVSPFVIYGVAPFPAVSRPSAPPRCDFGTLGDGDLPVLIETNNPAHFTIAYGERGSAGLSVDADTPDSERTQWDTWVADDTTGIAFGNVVQTCVVLRDGVPPRDRQWEYTVEGDDGTATDSEQFVLYGPGRRRGRPLTLVSRVDDNHVRVWAPFGPPESPTSVVGPRDDHVVVLASSAAEDDLAGTGRTCEAIERYGFDRYLRAGEYGRIDSESTEDLPADLLARDDYPFDPAYSRAHVAVLRLDEGTQHHVCVWWVGRGNQINEREEHLVTTPSRYRIRVAVEAVDLNARAADGNPVAARILSTVDGDALCGERAVFEPGPLCDLTGSGNTARLGDSVDLQIRGPFTSRWQTTRVPVPKWPCGATGATGARICVAEQQASYRVTVPGSRIVGLCGGTGTCDPPTGGRSVGTVTLRFEFIDGPDAAGRDYVWGGGTPFFGPSGAHEPAPYPTLRNAEIGERRSDALELVVDADRSVTVRAYPIEYRGYSPCPRPGADQTATAGPAISNHLLVDGLCAAAPYFFGVELTDDSGARSYVGGRPPDAPDGPVVGGPVVGITNSVSAGMLATLTVLAGPEGPDRSTYVERAAVTIGGYGPFGWGTRSELGCMGIGRPIVNTWRTGLPEAVELTVDVVAWGGDTRDGRPRCAAVGTRGQSLIRQTIAVDDLLAGLVVLESAGEDPVRVRIELAISRA